MLIPRLRKITCPQFLAFDKVLTSNGTPVYIIKDDNAEVLRIDFLFKAGAFSQEKPLQSSMTLQMLKEGTAKHNSEEIAEQLDYCGALLDVRNMQNCAFVSLTLTNKSFDTLWPLFCEVLSCPAFPEHEFQLMQHTLKQSIRLREERVSYWARRRFYNNLFGNQSSIGHIRTVEDVERVSIDDLKSHFKKYYNLNNCAVVVAGKVTANVIKELESFLNNSERNVFESVKYPFVKCKEYVSRDYIKKEGAVQSAVIIGKPAPSFSDEDYDSFEVLNAALGGYFGSRLMTEIREKKGYTYDITSVVQSSREYSTFGISAQTATEYTDSLIADCYAEMQKLIERKMSKSELEKLKKYLHGEMLRNVDGLFSAMGQFEFFLRNGLDASSFRQSWDAVSAATPEEMQRLAQKYFQPSSFCQVVCGA
ncbi:MAG: insulinase family protein [Bacteroidales bacterium]|nr:insulinase family protein [Bacteroidales bacterium]